LLGDRPSGFVLDQWQRGIGASALAPRPQGLVIGDDARLGCDAQACVYDHRGARISLVRDPAVWMEACAEAGLVIALEPIPERCAAPVLAARDPAIMAGASLRATSDGPILRSVVAEQGARPWQAGLGPRD
jgi:competence protein ComEC